MIIHVKCYCAGFGRGNRRPRMYALAADDRYIEGAAAWQEPESRRYGMHEV